MKNILIILLFAFTPLNAQMEFERVWQVYPDGGYARGTDLFFKHDTILLKTRSNHSGDLETNYFYSTNEGENWKDIRDDFILETPIEDKYDYLGEIHPLTFEFVKPYRYNDTTTFIYYLNLQGEIQKKVTYPYLPDYLHVRLNPIDPNFISIHSPKERMFPFEYNHNVGYSSDRGDTWNYMRPEQELKKQRDINLASLRKIEYRFSTINKGKILYNFTWSDGSNFFYRLTTNYNYFDKSYSFLSRDYSFDKLLCYECFEENNLTFVNLDTEEIDSFDGFTGTQSTMNFKDRLPLLNSDSLESINKQIEISGSWGGGFGFLKTNVINKNHKILHINIRSDYISETGRWIDYLNQLFFQTFDNGKTWEFLFNNDDLGHQVTKMFLDQEKKELWILKDSTVANMTGSQSWYPILYKSKSPLTSIDDYSSENVNVSYSNRTLSIISDNNYTNARVNIFNTNGQLLISKTTSIRMGENVLQLNNPINERLILIQINTDKSHIFKLIRSD